MTRSVCLCRELPFSLSFEPKKVRSKKRLGPEKEMPGDEGRASEEFRTYLLIDLEQGKYGDQTKAEQFGKGYEFRFLRSISLTKFSPIVFAFRLWPSILHA